ncbi:thermonuclease [Saccharibacillus sp. O23]|uniref:thermonuclease family protein n=1 Tax=Saccharibacillus sp. O23 TaxID=2009338 RepID=UPI000B4E15B3|nr:thermonuclease family protein [Saccharibacillus sp. O23]OWR28450.1 thermonuclease [Saccharibacillus sp. O23]
MKSTGDTPQNGGPKRPKRSLISIVVTIVVLALLLFTDKGRDLLGNWLQQGETSQTESTRQTEQGTEDAGRTDSTSSSPEPAQNGRVGAKVERTVDGDTFIAQLADGSRERVRMLLIDTPETKKEGTPVQPFGTEASDYTKKLLTGRDVELEFDEEQRDQYDRMLAYVYLDGESVNEKLLEQGLARVVVYKPNDKYVKEFRELQAEAKSEKIGVWSIEGYADNRGFHPEAAK